MLALVHADDSTKTVIPAADRVEFTQAYDEWFAAVVRWIPAMGGNSADVEDIAQEVFLVARRKWETFDQENLGGWLYAIALGEVRNHRRLSWFRNLLFQPTEKIFDRPDPAADPAETLERKQLGKLAERVLATLSEKHRRAFVLFEFEEYSGEEIAALENIPVATVWTRLHHARKEFVAGCKQLRRTEGL